MAHTIVYSTDPNTNKKVISYIIPDFPGFPLSERFTNDFLTNINYQECNPGTDLNSLLSNVGIEYSDLNQFETWCSQGNKIDETELNRIITSNIGGDVVLNCPYSCNSTSATFDYEWKHNTIDLTHTNSSLTLNNVSKADEGVYTCIVKITDGDIFCVKESTFSLKINSYSFHLEVEKQNNLVSKIDVRHYNGFDINHLGVRIDGNTNITQYDSTSKSFLTNELQAATKFSGTPSETRIEVYINNHYICNETISEFDGVYDFKFTK